MSTLKLLIRPTIFTVGLCGTCFCGAAIYQYENRSKRYTVCQCVPNWITQEQQKYKSTFNRKYLQLRQDINAWKNQLTTGQKIAAVTISTNLMVFTAWRFNRLRPVMSKFFTSQISSSKIALSPMLLSCFSHASGVHLAFNMYALYSFSEYATALLGPEQLIALYLSAGTISSLASIGYRLLTNRTIGSLGASGALLGVVAYICVARPDSRLLLFFLPIAAGNAIKSLMILDTIGLIARWKYIDHAAHLGGSLFGVWYAMYGEKYFYKYRRSIVDEWLKIKDKVST